mmetsp:Transcript_13918/g.23554  ORF Transcript_13918/g.23554 Transcript_13918/m.23554 type:complete len:479 (-) Transcript_13918:473-1909(-)
MLASQNSFSRVLGPTSRTRLARRCLSTTRPKQVVEKRRSSALVHASLKSNEALPDWLSGGKQFSREVLTAYEIGNASFGPKVFTAGAFLLPLMAALPTSLGDCVRGQAASETLAVLAGNSALVFVLMAFMKSQAAERTRKLERLATELALGDMKVASTDRLGNEKVLSLRDLRNSRRVALLYGTPEKVNRDLVEAQVYRRRLEASSIIVIPVVEDSQDRVDAIPSGYTMMPPADKTWVAFPLDSARQGFDVTAYFQQLLKESTNNEGAYITLGLEGRVRGSGEGSPRWDTLLSTFPQQLLDSAGMQISKSNTKYRENGLETATDDVAKAVLEVHENFYAALAKGDETLMSSLWVAPGESSPVTAYEKKGARLDSWATVLREDRRPIGMTVGDADVLIGPDGRIAYVTSLETVTTKTTLLATQRLELVEGHWRVVQHQTIPYGKDIIAKIVLTCDARGCVALPAKAVASSVSARNFKLK